MEGNNHLVSPRHSPFVGGHHHEKSASEAKKMKNREVLILSENKSGNRNRIIIFRSLSDESIGYRWKSAAGGNTDRLAGRSPAGSRQQESGNKNHDSRAWP